MCIFFINRDMNINDYILLCIFVIKHVTYQTIILYKIIIDKSNEKIIAFGDIP